MVNKGLKVYGIITLIAIAITNIFHLFWTVWISVEQVKTGWGGGTSMEMLVLLPWTLEILAIPIVITAAVFIVFSILNKWCKKLFFWNVLLLGVLLTQITIFNLFLYY